MSGLWAELRPYLVVWPAARRLTLGTWRLAVRLWDACMAGEGSDKVWRALGAVAVAVFTWRIVVRAPVVELLLLAAWAVAAWRAGPKPTQQPDDEQAAAVVDDGQEQPNEPDDEPDAGPLLPTIDELTEALHHVADPHAHVAAAATHLNADPAHVREALKQAGIPTHPVRVRGRGVSTGVKQTDLPPLHSPDETAPDGVVAAGQPSNNNTAGVVLETPHLGMTIIRYPDDTARRSHTVPRR